MLNADVGAVLWVLVVVDFLHHLIFTPIGDAFPGIGAHLGSAAGVWFWILLWLLLRDHAVHDLPEAHVPAARRPVRRPLLLLAVRAVLDRRQLPRVQGEVVGVRRRREAPVLLGRRRSSDSQIKTLESLGVKAIINLCDEFKGPARTYRKKKMTLLWLKTVDHMEPTVEAMHTACSFIEHHRKNGTGVYIHCKSGRGRSAAVAMAWLLHHKRMTLREAQDHLLSMRKARSSSADAPAHPADAPSGRPAPRARRRRRARRPEGERPAPPPSQVRSKLWKQRNCVTFYEEGRGTGGGGDLEGGYAARRIGRSRSRRRRVPAAPARCRRANAARRSTSCVRRCAAARCRGPARCPSLAWTRSRPTGRTSSPAASGR